MKTIEQHQLVAVVGGKTATTSPDGTTTYSQTNYETCVASMERGGNDKYPDTRTWLGRMLGTTDPNAGPRADWTRDAVAGACGPPPAGS